MSADPSTESPAFRWQSLFQRADDPLFVLNHRHRILFVNRAWEALTGLPASEARGLICRRADPVSANDGFAEILAHALCPPPEIKTNRSTRIRRFLPGQPAGRRWWDVEFVPLVAGGKRLALFGRVQIVSGVETDSQVPLPEALANLRQRAVEHYDLAQWPVELPSQRRLVEQALLAATTRVPVLLESEAGVGKEYLARCIHHLGPHREGSFIALDCARLPAAALEYWLFPRVAATTSNSTLYLREPARLPADLQMRLVSLMERESEKPRIMAGSREDLREAVRAGRMLDTLYQALATLVLPLTPLRDRLQDLPMLVSQMLERCNRRGDKQIVGLETEVREILPTYSWPGNLTELYAVLNAAHRHATGTRIGLADLPASLRLSLRLQAIPPRAVERTLDLDRLLEETERRLIQLALARHPGSKTKAAEALAITRQRLLRRMEALGLKGADGADEAS